MQHDQDKKCLDDSLILTPSTVRGLRREPIDFIENKNGH
jgi:hypothetical protein